MPNIKKLPAELQKIVENELGEVPARTAADLEALKDWIKKEPHLNARQDNQFFSLEKAKEKIDLFFTLKSKFPDFFNTTDIHDVKFRQMFDYGYGMPLPTPLNDNSPRIVRIAHWF